MEQNICLPSTDVTVNISLLERLTSTAKNSIPSGFGLIAAHWTNSGYRLSNRFWTRRHLSASVPQAFQTVAALGGATEETIISTLKPCQAANLSMGLIKGVSRDGDSDERRRPGLNALIWPPSLEKFSLVSLSSGTPSMVLRMTRTNRLTRGSVGPRSGAKEAA